MYYKTRKVIIDRMKGVLNLEIADSNVSPVHYRWTEYGKEETDIKEKLKLFFISCIDGNFKLQKSCGIEKVIVDEAKKLYDVATEGISFREMDKVLEKTVKETIVTKYCVPRAMLSKWTDLEYLFEVMRDYNRKLKGKVLETNDKLKEEGKIRIDAANSTSIYEGYDVFIKDTECILSPKDNYVNGSGILDVSKGDAIFFGPGTEAVWDILRCDGYKNETKEEIIARVQSYAKTERDKEQIREYYEVKFALAEAKIKEFASHLPMSNLPYKDFPYEETIDNNYLLIQKLHELTSNYMALETDSLANAGEFSRLSWEIEEVAMKICMQGTDLTEDEMIDFLDSRHVTA